LPKYWSKQDWHRYGYGPLRSAYCEAEAHRDGMTSSNDLIKPCLARSVKKNPAPGCFRAILPSQQRTRRR